MSVEFASRIGFALIAYLVVGTAYAVFAQIRGIDREDEDVRGATRGFRVLILPALIVLWPILLARGLEPGVPRTAHDQRSVSPMHSSPARARSRPSQFVAAVLMFLVSLAVLVTAWSTSP